MGKWEEIRQRHWDYAVASGRADLKTQSETNFRGGNDIFLGGFIQRVYDGQSEKLWCDDPAQWGNCPYVLAP